MALPFVMPSAIKVGLSYWREAAIGILALAMTFCYWQWDVTDAKLDACRTQNELTISQYVGAQAEAMILQLENLSRVAAERQEITERITNDYENRIAAARATADRLRRELNGVGRPSGDVPVPSVSDTAGGVDGTSAISGVALSVDERLGCVEDAIRLDSLQNWAREQSEVEVNPEEIENGHDD